LATACGSAPASSDGPKVFASSSGVSSTGTDQVPNGHNLVACPLGDELTVVLVVPDRFDAIHPTGRGCLIGSSRSFETVGVQASDRTLAEEKQDNLDPFEDQGGDDSVSDISYRNDVDAFGGKRGERLEYECFCDGQELHMVRLQAAGIVLSSEVSQLDPAAADPLPLARSTLGVERGRFVLIGDVDHGLRYPFEDWMDSLDASPAGFTAYPRDQRGEQWIIASFDEEGLARLRDDLARDPTVSELELEDVPDAVGGDAGARLSYRQRVDRFDGEHVDRHVVLGGHGLRVDLLNDDDPTERKSLRDGLEVW